MNKYASAMYVCMETHPTVVCLRGMFEAINFVVGVSRGPLGTFSPPAGAGGLGCSHCARCWHMAATELRVLKDTKGWLSRG